jgi:protein-arginine kinase activator protein McsA
MVIKERIEMVKIGCPNCGNILKIADKGQWVCAFCYSRLLPGMKKWKVAPAQKSSKVNVKRGRGRPRKEAEK